MTSEAAVYFPEALANPSEVREPVIVTTGPLTGSAIEVRQESDAAESQPKAIILIAEISDDSLLERVGQGDKEALALLFRRHARTVRNVARRILRDEAEADDLVQDVFIFLFRKASLYKASHGTALSWIMQATYHRAFNRRSYLNTRHFYTNSDLAPVLETISSRQAEAIFAEWTLEGVWGSESAARLRQLLSPSQLATIELHFFEGYTLEEIAERLGQTLGNIRNHYYRGLEKLRKPAFASKLRSK